MLSPEGVAYFKKYSPIGCRDLGTKVLLQQYGVPCFFSGCLTLTLGRKYKKGNKNGKIYFVDPYYENIFINNEKVSYSKILFLIPLIIKNLIKIFKISRRLLQYRLYDFIPTSYLSGKRFLYAVSFYCAYRRFFSDDVLLNCEMLTHYMPSLKDKNDNERFDYAESLIEKYASAALVVTSRVHCALPCLGLETPVIFTWGKDLDQYRFGGIINLFRVINYVNGRLSTDDDYLKAIDGKITKKTKIKNKQDYLHLKEELIKICENFIKI
jgi:hypothetical protein